MVCPMGKFGKFIPIRLVYKKYIRKRFGKFRKADGS